MKTAIAISKGPGQVLHSPSTGPIQGCGALKDHEDCGEVWKRKVVVVSRIAVKKPLRSSERR
jgi:hypothetical protein